MSAAGALVCVVGPSGAGKDSVIAGAKARLAGDPRVIFPRRIVTRGASAFEDHDTIDPAAFEAADAAGRYALSWRAHGLGYALPGSVGEAVAGGAHAVCNVSRAVIPAARTRFSRVRIVLVTAPPETIRARLLARGRETPAAIDARRAREAGMDAVRADLTIVNTGTVDEAAEALMRFLMVPQAA